MYPGDSTDNVMWSHVSFILLLQKKKTHQNKGIDKS